MKLHEFRIVGLGVNCVELALDDTAGGAVERNPVAFLEDLSLDAHLARLFFDLDIARAGHAALAHAARDHCGVTGHTAARGQNADGDFHAVDVFGRGFRADQDDRIFLAVAGLLDGIVRGEDDLADGCARRSGQACGQHFNFPALLIQAAEPGSRKAGWARRGRWLPLS